MGKLYGDSKLADVDARLRAFAALAARELPFDLVVLEGRRTVERQAELYAKGRTTAGPVVTYARPEEAPHVRGGAVDLAPRESDGSGARFATDARYARLGSLAEREGLVWGGRWTQKFGPGGDAAHIELKDWRALPMVALAAGGLGILLLLAAALVALELSRGGGALA